MSTARKMKPVKGAGKQNTSEKEATEAKSSAMELILPVNGFTGFSPGDWESNTSTELRPPVEAAREIFLSDADRLCHQRLQVAIRAFRLNRFARAAIVLKLCLNGWIELLVGGDLLVGLRGVPLVQLAINYFGRMLAIAKQNPEIIGKPVPWAESQTRSALNQVLGTTWFSTPKPEIKAESRKVTLWLREIEETVFVPRPRPDPALKDNKAIVEQWLTWHAHGWLATWLPPSTPALSRYVDRPLEPLLQEVQDFVVEDITSYLFHGVEDRLKRAVNIAQVEHACSNAANVSQNSGTKPTSSSVSVESPKNEDVQSQPSEGKIPRKISDFGKWMDEADLTDRQRTCFSYKLEHDLSVSEIARRLKISRAVVQEHIHAANRKIDQTRSNQNSARKTAKSRQE